MWQWGGASLKPVAPVETWTLGSEHVMMVVMMVMVTVMTIVRMMSFKKNSSKSNGNIIWLEASFYLKSDCTLTHCTCLRWHYWITQERKDSLQFQDGSLEVLPKTFIHTTLFSICRAKHAISVMFCKQATSDTAYFSTNKPLFEIEQRHCCYFYIWLKQVQMLTHDQSSNNLHNFNRRKR